MWIKKKEQNNLVYSKKTLFGILAYVLLSVIKIVILINIKRKKKTCLKGLINDSVIACDKTVEMPEIDSINSSEIIPTY